VLKIYDYWRSSAAYRVRIGLHLKGVAFEQVPVNIRPDVREQFSLAYLRANPQARVPALETERGVLVQSLAILEWLEETHPSPALLPADPWERAQVRAFAQALVADVHPLNNVGPLAYLRETLGADEAAIAAWIAHWMERGLAALEIEAGRRRETAFCFGDAPGLADLCLVPQMYSARRFGVDLTRYPRLASIDARARTLDAFVAAAPDNQKDAAPT
jgi:maleylpyruvate isomerase